MNRLTALFATALVLAACKQNPFPESGRIVQKEPDPPAPVVPPLVLDVPDSSEVVEGQKLEIQLVASVPEPGKPLLTVQGLPEGAVFSPETMKITWSPGFEAANDDRDESVLLRTYPIHFVLSSSEDPVTITQRSSLIVVRDLPRPITMGLPTTPIQMNEGDLHEQVIQVKSEDFPKGPFQIQIKNVPMGATILRDLTDPTKFTVKYSPSFREVNFREATTTSGDTLVREMEVTAFAPRGASVTEPLVWRIKDSRSTALVFGPKKITQGMSVSFSVSAEDPNGEEAPSITLKPRPGFGLADLKTEAVNTGNPSRGVNPSQVATFRWTQIPPEQIGQTSDVTFNVCVKRTMWLKDLCKEHKVAVTFEKEEHKPPVIDRKEYPAGSIVHLREKESKTIAMPVRDGERASTAPSVVVNPVSDEVTWKAGALSIDAKKAGLKQFSVTATSVFGVTQVEAFLLEVLPWSWSGTLLFGDGPNHAEVKATRDFFENPQIANPSLQLGDPRLLVLRDLVYIGTSAFDDTGAISPMEKQAVTVANVFLSSPAIAKLEGSLKDELAKLDIVIGTRLADLTGYSLELGADAGLVAPTDPFKLAGKLTPESATPAPVSSTNADCRTLFVLKKALDPVLPVAVSCKRAGGGRLVVAGFEFGDVQTSPADKPLIKNWLTSLVSK